MGDEMGEESFPGFFLMMTDDEEDAFEDEEECLDDDEEEDPDSCDDGLDSPREHGRRQWQGIRDYASRAFRAGSPANTE